MQLILIPLLSLLPCLLWLFYFWRQDRYDREPLKNIAITFGMGMLATALAFVPNTVASFFMQVALGPNPNIIASAFLSFLFFFFVVGPVEEGSKFLAVYLYAYRRPEFDEPVDGIVYSATAALGFAAAENVLYLSTTGASTIFLRGLLSNPGHALFSAFWGLAMSRAKAMPNLTSKRVPVLIKGWLLAAFAHGLFDFILTIGQAMAKSNIIPPIIVFAFVAMLVLGMMVGMFVYVKLRIIKMVEQSPHKEGTRLLGNFMPCQQCGRLGHTGQFCEQCGTQVAAPTDQRYCLKCGAQQRLGASFCNRCGYTLIRPLTTTDQIIQPAFISVDQTGREEIACVINQENIKVGKTLDNEFVIDHPTISKRHAQISRDPSNTYHIHDLGSTNGTFINGKRIQEATLKDGCEVRFGSTQFIFRLSQPSPLNRVANFEQGSYR